MTVELQFSLPFASAALEQSDATRDVEHLRAEVDRLQSELDAANAKLAANGTTIATLERAVEGRRRRFVPRPIAPAVPGPDETKLDAEFRTFYAAHPFVYDLLVRLTRQAVAAGHKHLGIGAIYERARWELMFETHDASYKLNNNHRSRYARLISEREPDLAHVFELRELRS